MWRRSAAMVRSRADLFLREAIAKHDFQDRGCDISLDEIFVSDGAKCDVGNMQEIFAESDIVAITNPVYPVYVDSNVMAGRSGKFVRGAYERFEFCRAMRSAVSRQICRLMIR